MTDRPTPEQIGEAMSVVLGYGSMPLTRLNPILRWVRDQMEAGAVIVHPDDVPEREPFATYNRGAWNRGWNACRQRVLRSTERSDDDE